MSWFRRAWCRRGARRRAVLDVDEETVINAAAIFDIVTRTALTTLADVFLVSRDVVGAVTVLILDDGEGERALVSAVIGAVAIGHILLDVCDMLVWISDCDKVDLQTSVSAVFCFEQYAWFHAARAGVARRRIRRTAKRPDSECELLRAMVANV